MLGIYFIYDNRKSNYDNLFIKRHTLIALSFISLLSVRIVA